jgi:hypothetical protein
MELNIIMDEEEMSKSDLSEDALRQVLKILGPKCKDKLLIPRDDDA